MDRVRSLSYLWLTQLSTGGARDFRVRKLYYYPYITTDGDDAQQPVLVIIYIYIYIHMYEGGKRCLGCLVIYFRSGCIVGFDVVCG